MIYHLFIYVGKLSKMLNNVFRSFHPRTKIYASSIIYLYIYLFIYLFIHLYIFVIYLFICLCLTHFVGEYGAPLNGPVEQQPSEQTIQEVKYRELKILKHITT